MTHFTRRKNDERCHGNVFTLQVTLHVGTRRKKDERCHGNVFRVVIYKLTDLHPYIETLSHTKTIMITRLLWFSIALNAQFQYFQYFWEFASAVFHQSAEVGCYGALCPVSSLRIVCTVQTLWQCADTLQILCSHWGSCADTERWHTGHKLLTTGSNFKKMFSKNMIQDNKEFWGRDCVLKSHF